MDLFASEESAHCPLFFSWTEVTVPLGQDALAHDWPQSPLYAFPPLPPDSSHTPEGVSAGPQATSGGPLLARETMFSTSAQALLQLSMAPPLQEGPLSKAGCQI